MPATQALPGEADIGVISNPLPKVSDAASYGALPAGASFLDPEGKTRKKPWAVKDSSSYDAVPEGESFLDPEGNLRKKPKYEGVDFTTQTLYDMALTDSERRKALERSYGKENVKEGEGTGELYVEQDGQFLKPGRGDLTKRAGAFVTSQAAPVIGAVVGGVAGGAGWSVLPGAGTAGGAILGSAAGGAAGQGFNDMVLSLAGIYDRSAGEELGNLALSGGASAAGEGLGRALPAAYYGVKGALGNAKNALPYGVAKILGATETPEATARAARLAEQGVRVPPSAWMPESPYLKKTVEEFDPAFRKQNVLEQSAKKYYESKAGGLLEELGIPKEGREPLTAATSPISSEKAGQAAMQRIRTELNTKDAALQDAMRQAKMAAEAKAGISPHEYEKSKAVSLARLAETEQSSRAAAQTAIDAGFTSIRQDIAEAAIKAGVNENPGDLMRAAAGKIRGLNAAVKARAAKIYEAADVAAGDAKPNIGTLPQDAKEFLAELPEDFQKNYPTVIKAISNLKPGQTTFGQLRNLRSIIRHDIDQSDLTPSIRDGAYKFFAGKINKVIHDTEAVPELKTATKILDSADAFYARNMPRFRDEVVKGIVSALKAGMPADAQTVAKMIFREGQAERMREVRKIVGPNLWSAVQAADTQSMFDASKTLVPGEIDGRSFASQVLDRVKTGVLENGYSKELASKLTVQAQRVMAMEGKIPLTQLPGDTVTTALKRADDAAQAAKQLAKDDPLGSLKGEISRIDKEYNQQAAKIQRDLRSDPLGFLAQPNWSARGIEAADRILRSPDLLMAAANRFGEQSPEFTMLRQVGAHRLLQRAMGKTGALASEFGEKITPEVQALLFPGVTLEHAQMLAKDMEFLMGGEGKDVGGSIAAMQRVLHPFGSIPFAGKFIEKIPGAAFLGRFTLTKYYQLLTWGTTHPAFVQWVAKGLQGPPEQREAVRAAAQKALGMTRLGGAIGAGAGQEMYQENK